MRGRLGRADAQRRITIVPIGISWSLRSGVYIAQGEVAQCAVPILLGDCGVCLSGGNKQHLAPAWHNRRMSPPGAR